MTKSQERKKKVKETQWALDRADLVTSFFQLEESSTQPENKIRTSRNPLLKLFNYSCSSYPTRASYSGQVDGFRNPMKNELKNGRVWKPVFETISNTDANFVNPHIDKATKTRGDKQLYLITHFMKQTLNLDYLLITLDVTEQFLKNPKQKRPFFF